MIRIIAICALCLVAGSASADSIVVEGVRHENVLIRESSRLYYVQDIATGKVWNVERSRVAAGDVQKEDDPDRREALQAEWARASGEKRPAINYIQAPAEVAASGERELGDATRSDGKVPLLKLKGVPVSTALDAVLRPLNLDYQVQEGYIFISTPEILARESLEPIETRTYSGIGDAYETLPKIVLRSPAGVTGGGFTGGFGGGQGAGGGQRGNIGGFGGNAGGGFAGGGFGGGGGQGGFGGQGGGNARDVTQLSNISELFTNIDDTLVGEAPAQIGIGYQVRRGR